MIFVDTSFWVAIRNDADDRHGAALSVIEAHADTQLLTTNHVRGETWTFLRRRIGHAAAVDFLDSLGSSPRVELVAVPDEDEVVALAWLRRHDEREYSWVDATSFATMKRLRIAEAMAFDEDFTAAGFIELRT
ncbi:MAG: type II toxin-antitoxin system VapC family toxin [Chloroflexota bacterium]